MDANETIESLLFSLKKLGYKQKDVAVLIGKGPGYFSEVMSRGDKGSDAAIPILKILLRNAKLEEELRLLRKGGIDVVRVKEHMAQISHHVSAIEEMLSSFAPANSGQENSEGRDLSKFDGMKGLIKGVKADDHSGKRHK